LFVALSLVLCLATITLWVRSWLVSDTAYVQLVHPRWRTDIERYCVVSARGTVQAARWWSLHDRQSLALWRAGPVTWHWERCAQRLMLPLEAEQPVEDFDWPAWTRWGFHWSDTSGYSSEPDGLPPNDRTVVVSAPYWSLALLFAVVPGARAMTLSLGWARRRRCRRQGRCVACGYDLRGSPQRCPECGEEAIARFACE
jgi:hypothetical protein